MTLDLRVNDQPVDAITLTEWQELEFSCDPPPGGTLALSIGSQPPLPLQPFLRPGDLTWRWRWNPQNAVGRFSLVLSATWPDGHTAERRATLTVVPRKIDQERYDLLLDDLQRVARNIVYALAGGSVAAATQPVDEPQAQTLLEEYFSLFDQRFATFEQAVERVARRPHTVLRSTSERVDIGQAHDLSHVEEAMTRGVFEREPVTNDRRPLPSEVSQSRSTVSFDTYENRLLKRLLGELHHRARYIATAAGRQAQHSRGDTGRAQGLSLQHIAERSDAIAQRLRTMRTLPFLSEVGHLTRFQGPSQVLQRDAAYRQIYRMWQDLRRTPFIAVESALFTIPLHDVPRLYENWCAVQLAWALMTLPGAGVQHQQLVTTPVEHEQLDPDDATGEQPSIVALVEDVPLLVLNWHDTTLRLRYQPRFRPRSHRQSRTPGLISLDRHTRVPDLVLEIERPGEVPALLVCDAKYRLDATGGVPEDALADAYAYLGSIGTDTGARVTHLAMLLYPGQGDAEWYPSGVGALPLLPGATAALRTWLEQALTSQTDSQTKVACNHSPCVVD